MAESSECYAEDACVICHSKFDSNDEVVAVGDKGLITLAECSKSVGNVNLADFLTSATGVVKVHAGCRRQYTKKGAV